MVLPAAAGMCVLSGIKAFYETDDKVETQIFYTA